jgi:hypothetical protein
LARHLRVRKMMMPSDKPAAPQPAPQERIKQRLVELHHKLKEANEADKSGMSYHEQIAAIHRLEGNIGALEWVLRQ